MGVPEGTAAGPDRGMRQPTAGLSLEGLTALNVDGHALPRLAASWTWEDEGRTLRVKLRPDVVFHDGTKMNASSSAEALREAISRPGNRALYSSLADVKDVSTDGESDLLIHLIQPSAFLPEDLELPLARGNQTGTGPFKVVKNEATEVVLDRFDHYYLGTPSIQRVTIRPFNTLRTAWTSLLRGDIDMVTSVPPEAVEFVQNDNVQVVSFSRRYQYVIAFNSKQGPLKSPAVRRALNIAIDRDEIIKKVLQGHGIPSTGPLWPQHWAYDRSIPGYGYQPALAKSLLDGGSPRVRLTSSNGAPDASIRFTCLLPANFSILERLALEVQRQLYNVGVDMQFQVLPVDEFNTRISQGQFEATMLDMISGPSLGRAYIFWRSSRRFKGLNTFGYENDDAERMFDLLRTSTNDGAVRSSMNRLQRVLQDDPPALFLAWNDRTMAVRRDFKVVDEPGRDPFYTIWRWAPGMRSVR
jgi:peptide/nickel transport system substrate-binding protein